MAVSGRWTWSPSPLPELLLELTDELILLLDDKVLSPEIVQERIFIVVGVGLVMGLRLGQDRSLALLGDRFFTSPGMLLCSGGAVPMVELLDEEVLSLLSTMSLTGPWDSRRQTFLRTSSVEGVEVVDSVPL